MPFIDLESCLAIKDLYKDSKGGELELDPRKYFHRFALNTSLTLNYGIRIDGGIDEKLLREGEEIQFLLRKVLMNRSCPRRKSGLEFPEHIQQLAGLYPTAAAAVRIEAEQVSG